jgi:Spy/CpxP family protein refolding chaperone
MRVSRTVIVSVIALGIVGLLAFGAWAVTNDDDGFGRGGPWRHEGGWGGHGGWGGNWGPDPEQVREARADLAADMAAQLDISAEQVEAAFRGVAEQRLGEAVADGRIDQAEADEALAAYDEGDIGQIFRIVKGGSTPTAENSESTS